MVRRGEKKVSRYLSVDSIVLYSCRVWCRELVVAWWDVCNVCIVRSDRVRSDQIRHVVLLECEYI